MHRDILTQTLTHILICIAHMCMRTLAYAWFSKNMRKENLLVVVCLKVDNGRQTELLAEF